MNQIINPPSFHPIAAVTLTAIVAILAISPNFCSQERRFTDALPNDTNATILGPRSSGNKGKCEPITIASCQGIRYGMTIMPNSIGHRNQAEAEVELRQFSPLVAIKCSPILKFFLCATFVPACSLPTETETKDLGEDLGEVAVPPCRHLCLEAKAGCEPLMKRFSYDWPNYLDCQKFPISGRCVEENGRTEYGDGDNGNGDNGTGNDADRPTTVLERRYTTEARYSDSTSYQERSSSSTEAGPDRTSASALGPQRLSVNKGRECQPITIPACKGIQYDMTIMPNLIGHRDQAEARVIIDKFSPLITLNCSPKLNFFLCTMFVPVCSSSSDNLGTEVVAAAAVPPCRSLCLETRSGCEPTMKFFGYSWPEYLDCQKLPLSGLCVVENRTRFGEGNGSVRLGTGLFQLPTTIFIYLYICLGLYLGVHFRMV